MDVRSTLGQKLKLIKFSVITFNKVEKIRNDM